MEKTGIRIKQLREQKGLTLEELGNMIGVQKAAVQKWESGKVVNLKRATIKKLADIFGVTSTHLIGMDDGRVKKTTIEHDGEIISAYYPAIKNALDDGLTKEQIVSAIEFARQMKKQG